MAVVAAAVTVVALVVWPDSAGTGRSIGGAGSPTPSPSRGDAPIDLSGLPIARDLDCAALDDAAVATALDGAVTARDGYTDGDRVEVAPGVTDVAHETSCSFATDEARGTGVGVHRPGEHVGRPTTWPATAAATVGARFPTSRRVSGRRA